jgi:hypothetical protein
MENKAETKPKRTGWGMFMSFLAGGGILVVFIGIIGIAMLIAYLVK